MTWFFDILKSVWDAIYQFAEGVWDFFVALFREVLWWCYNAAENAWAWAKETVAELWYRCLQWVVDYTPDVDDLLEDVYDEEIWDAAFGMFTDLSWIFPLQECFVIIVAAFSYAAVIRLVRFIIGWVPTVEG